MSTRLLQFLSLIPIILCILFFQGDRGEPYLVPLWVAIAQFLFYRGAFITKSFTEFVLSIIGAVGVLLLGLFFLWMSLWFEQDASTALVVLAGIILLIEGTIGLYLSIRLAKKKSAV